MEAEIKIVNRTSYDSDDLLAFMQQIIKTINAPDWSIPSEVLVSYYTPTPPEKLVPQARKRRKQQHIVPSPYKFLNWEGRRNKIGPQRFGLLRPAALFKSPLAQLASVADGELLAPVEMLAELAGALARYCFERAWLSEPGKPVDLEHAAWSWILNFKLHYSLRKPKLSSQEKIAQDLKLLEVEIERLDDIYWNLRNARRRLQQQADNAETKEYKVNERLDALRAKQETLKSKLQDRSAK